MIWATISSQSCFCWLYRASSSLTAKNIINLILVPTIWWCPCVESSLVLLEEGICYDQCFLLAKCLCPVSFCTPRPNMHVTPGVSWLLLLRSSPLQWERYLFWPLVLEGLVSLHGTVELQLLQPYWWWPRLGLPWYWMIRLGNAQRTYCHFWDCILDSFVDYEVYSISSKGFLPTVVDIMVIWV